MRMQREQVMKCKGSIVMLLLPFASVDLLDTDESWDPALDQLLPCLLLERVEDLLWYAGAEQ